MTTLLKKIARGWFNILNDGGFLSYLVWLFTATLVGLFLDSSINFLKYAIGGELKNDVNAKVIWLEDNVDLDGSDLDSNKENNN
mgnify:CR=1 FL=1